VGFEHSYTVKIISDLLMIFYAFPLLSQKKVKNKSKTILQKSHNVFKLLIKINMLFNK